MQLLINNKNERNRQLNNNSCRLQYPIFNNGQNWTEDQQGNR